MERGEKEEKIERGENVENVEKMESGGKIENGDKREFLRHAAVLSLSGFIAKLIGAAYRVPLANLVGGYGIGLYQMVYPVYSLLLTLSATGIPTAISKLVSERRALGVSERSVFLSALKLFALIGGVGTLISSLASLITFREYTTRYPEKTWSYIRLFSVLNFGFLIVFSAPSPSN